MSGELVAHLHAAQVLVRTWSLHHLRCPGCSKHKIFPRLSHHARRGTARWSVSPSAERGRHTADHALAFPLGDSSPSPRDAQPDACLRHPDPDSFLSPHPHPHPYLVTDTDTHVTITYGDKHEYNNGDSYPYGNGNTDQCNDTTSANSARRYVHAISSTSWRAITTAWISSAAASGLPSEPGSPPRSGRPGGTATCVPWTGRSGRSAEPDDQRDNDDQRDHRSQAAGIERPQQPRLGLLLQVPDCFFPAVIEGSLFRTHHTPASSCLVKRHRSNAR